MSDLQKEIDEINAAWADLKLAIREDLERMFNWIFGWMK